MKRRSFIGGVGSVVGLSAGLAGCETQKAVEEKSNKETITLAGYSPRQLRAHYMTYLFDDFIPYFDTHVIDREYGDFLYNTDRDGTRISTDKGAWYGGRGIWVWSFLYNEIAREQKYLNVHIRQTISF